MDGPAAFCGLPGRAGGRGAKGRLNVTRRGREETAPARRDERARLQAGMNGRRTRRPWTAGPLRAMAATSFYDMRRVPSIPVAGPLRPIRSGPIRSGRRRNQPGPASRNSRLKQLPAQLGQTFLRAPMRIRLREHIRNIYCRARLTPCGAGMRCGQGASCSTRLRHEPASSARVWCFCDKACGKAGARGPKSGPGPQFAGRGPFVGLLPGAKVHGTITGPGARSGVPPARRMKRTGPPQRRRAASYRRAWPGSGRLRNRPATSGRQGDDNVGKRQQGDPGGQSGSRS